MAEVVISFQNQTVGGQPSGSYDNINAVSNGAALVISQDTPNFSDLGARFVRMLGATAGSTQTAIKWLLSTLLTANPATVELIFYIRLSATPSVDVPFAQYDDGGGTSAGQIYVRGTTNIGRLALLTQGTTREIGTATITANQWVRVGVLLTAGTSTTDGQVRAAWALGDQTTLQADTGAITGINIAGTTAAFASFRAGKYGTNSYAGNVDIGRIVIRTGTDISANFKPYTPASVNAASGVKPISIITNPGGVTIGGTAISLATALSDGDTSTYAINPDTASNESLTVRWPPVRQGTSVACAFPLSLDTGSATQAVKLEVLQGSTVVATRTVTTTEMTTAGTTSTNFTVDVTGTHKSTDITWALNSTSGYYEAELWGRITFKAS